MYFESVNGELRHCDFPLDAQLLDLRMQSVRNVDAQLLHPAIVECPELFKYLHQLAPSKIFKWVTI